MWSQRSDKLPYFSIPGAISLWAEPSSTLRKEKWASCWKGPGWKIVESGLGETPGRRDFPGAEGELLFSGGC